MPLTGLENVDRKDPVYKACLVASTAGGAIAGGATGSVLGPAGTIGGYVGGSVWGFAAGYLACPYLAPMIKRKFELGQSFTEADLASATHAMSSYAQVTHAQDALRLIKVVKAEAVRKGAAPVCSNPSVVAKKLLTTA